MRSVYIRNTNSPQARFADLAEQRARQLLPDTGVLLVSLAPHGSDPLLQRSLPSFASRLTDAAASPRVRYLIHDPTRLGVLPAMDDTPRQALLLLIGVELA